MAARQSMIFLQIGWGVCLLSIWSVAGWP